MLFSRKKIFFLICYTGNGIRLGFSSTTTTSCFSHQAELRSCSSIRCRTCCCSWRRGRPGGSRWWRWWPRQQSTRPSSILSSRRAWLHSRDCALLRLFEENLKLHLWKPLELVYIVQCIYRYVVLSTRGCLTSLAAPIALYVLPFLLLHRSAPPPGLRLFFPLFFL